MGNKADRHVKVSKGRRYRPPEQQESPAGAAVKRGPGRPRLHADRAAYKREHEAERRRRAKLKEGK